MFNLNNILPREKCQLIYRQKDKNVKNETSALHHPLDPAGAGDRADDTELVTTETGRRNRKAPDRNPKVPVWRSVSLSGHFRVRVTV